MRTHLPALTLTAFSAGLLAFTNPLKAWSVTTTFFINGSIIQGEDKFDPNAPIPSFFATGSQVAGSYTLGTQPVNPNVGCSFTNCVDLLDFSFTFTSSFGSITLDKTAFPTVRALGSIDGLFEISFEPLLLNDPSRSNVFRTASMSLISDTPGKFVFPTTGDFCIDWDGQGSWECDGDPSAESWFGGYGTFESNSVPEPTSVLAFAVLGSAALLNRKSRKKN